MSTRTLRYVQVVMLVLLVASLGTSQMRSGKFGVGLAGTASIPQFDASQSETKFGGGLSLSYSMTEYIGLRSSFLMDQMQFTGSTPSMLGNKYLMNVFSLNAYLSLDMMPSSSINPFIVGGVGRAYFDGKGIDGVLDVTGSSWDLHFLVGGGFDIFLNEFISATVMGEYVMTGSDWYDGLVAGTAKDSYARVGLQLRYYMFDQDFLTKMLEALKDRYKGKGKK
jgi:hypothetical protein